MRNADFKLTLRHENKKHIINPLDVHAFGLLPKEG